MSAFETGSIVDQRYEILGVLGAGGMGKVYRARQLNLDRIVAIKVPSDAVLKNQSFLDRFIREARTCAQVAHANVVSIYDVHDKGVPYIVMEYVDGRALHDFLREEQMNLFVSDLLEIVGQVCKGLEAVHHHKVVHRDIKPANIVISNVDQSVKVMDFGIARVTEGTSVTVAGSMMGTPYYMAPEQIKGGEITPAADIYALSCVCYQLLTGRLVFEGEVPTLIYKHVSVRPDPPRRHNPALPRSVDHVLLRGLEKHPADRFHSALTFHRELRKALRTVGHLPYTQIFVHEEHAEPEETASAGGRNLESRPTNTAESEKDLVVAPVVEAAEAVASEVAEASNAGASAVGEQAAASAAPEEEKTAGESRKISPLFFVVPLVFILGFGAGLVFFLRSGSEGEPVEALVEGTPLHETPFSPSASPSPVAASTPEPTPEPARVLPFRGTISWLDTPVAEVARGDFVCFAWASAAGSVGRPLYRVEIRRGDTVVWECLTRQEKLARPALQRGRFECVVRVMNAEGEAALLRHPFSVLEKREN